MVSIFDSIADALADQGFAVTDQFLSQSEVKSILATDTLQQDAEKLTKAGIGKQQQHHINESIRGDYIEWLDKTTAEPALKVYLDRIEALRVRLNEALFLSLKDFEIHLALYPVGTFYKRYLDQFKKDDHRKLSVICYLNEEWEEHHGGQLRIYQPEGPQDILPVAGRLVCFRSDQLEHEVLPANRERRSLTGWILDQHADLRNL